MHTILRHDPLVISSLIGPTRNHHNMNEDKQQNQTRHDEADFPRGLASAEQIDEPGQDRIHSGDLVRPVSIISGSSTLIGTPIFAAGKRTEASRRDLC
jgi:hypothetical protein